MARGTLRAQALRVVQKDLVKQRVTGDAVRRCELRVCGDYPTSEGRLITEMDAKYMKKQAISSGSRFEAMAGYARAVAVGDLIFVAGTAGYDFETSTISPDAAAQARQALQTIERALGKAGANLTDVVRMVVYLSDRALINEVSAVLKAAFPDAVIANTTIICTLSMPEMKVELEATAVRTNGG
jgi:enamine deaminase RidA (YjgF/YER057c/UK114 family)